MKAKKLLIFLLCFVLLVGALAVVASAKGATETESVKEVTNSDGTVTTQYGNIPKSAASAETYPFAVFRYKNGALDSVVGQKTMRAALNNAKDWNNTWNKLAKVDGKTVNDTENTYTSTVLLRRDYSTIKYTDSNNVGDKFDNYAQLQNETVVDLNGYTITQGAGTSAIFFQVTSKPSSTQGYIFSSKYTFKNGDIALNDKPLFYGNIWNNLYNSDGTPMEGYSMADKHFTFNFENVTFKYVSGATTANMMFSSTGPQGLKDAVPKTPVAAAPFYFTYTDCTFDLTNAPSGAITLFNANPTADHWLKVTVVTNGCEIIAPAEKLANLTLYKTESTRGSSVTFSEGANGDVLTYKLPEGADSTTSVSSICVNLGGKQLYWHSVEANKYVLSECTDANSDNVCDVCGAQNVGGKWFSKADGIQTPFVILDANGNYVSTQTTWKNATNAVKNKDGYTIVLIGDYTNVASDSNNLKDFKGTFNVDLNGYTLTRGYNGAYLFDNWWDSVTVADTVTINFKNGTLNAEKWLICLSGNSALTVEKTANFNFDNVTFKLASNNDKTGGWIFEAHAQSYDQKITANITFDDCTFDTTAKATNSYPAFNLDVKNGSGIDYIKANVTFNGGKYVANNYQTNIFYQIHSDDTVTFGKGDNGEYLVLEMQGGKTPNTPAAADYITVDGTKMYFHKNGNVYTLSECLDAATHHKCTCGFVFSADCTDANKDHICDVCGKKSECIDENKDHACDLCDKTYTCAEADFDKNHVCDFCGSSFACADANKDEICDHCGYVMNDYGIKNIDPKYASVDKYPFFVLKLENGVYTFAGAYDKFYGRQGGSAINQAIYGVLRDSNKYDLENGVYVPEKSGGSVATAIVVMRRDYTIKMGNSKMDASTGVEYFDNIAHAQGEVIIDLGGHSLIEAEGSNKSVFTVTAKGWTGSADKVYTFPSTYTFKNGTVKSLKYAFVTIGTTDGVDVPPENYTGDPADWHWTVANSVMNVNFENVIFGLAEGATTATLAYATGSATNKYSSVAKVNVSFTDCIFDLKTVAPTKATTIINHNTSGKDVDEDIVVNGCEIIANNMANVTVCTNINANGSSLVFAKGENGKYITLTMPKGTAAPAATNTFVLDTGVVAAFNKSATAGDNDTYSVYPAVMLGYKIKTSVTLYTNFIYNVYVPVANVNKITVNGVVVDYEETEVDGVSYYLVKVNLAAAESLSDIKVTVTLNSGETTVDANWTLSVLKYTGSVINGDYNKVTKNLMKDMLAYATAAHNYFDNALSAEKAAMVESLLAGYSAALPTGEAKTPANSTYFKEIAVNVGAVPSFRFYLQTGYSIADFDFTVGGKTVTATEGIEDGKPYLDVAMFAYMMLDDVTYTVKANGETGTYNLYSYYNYASKLNIENLTAIVEGLMKYSASAELYRDYVVNNTCYHVYVDGKCTECGADDPDVGTMSISAPASIYSNYAGKDISVTFSKSWYKGEVTWTTDNTNVKVENGKILATGTSFDWQTPTKVTVTATTEDHTASVVVDVLRYRTTNVDVESKIQYYEKNIIKEENKGGIIFVGDSYFDGVLNSTTGMPPFWNDFYTDYAGEKAFLMGMSSSQIDELEIASERIVYPMEPSEIVVHIGHNDIHSGTRSVEEIVARIQALLNEYHAKLPNAKIYFCGVEPKKNAYDEGSTRYESSTVKAPALVAAMSAFADANDWLEFIDTYAIFHRDGAVNTALFPEKDGSHPTLAAYDIIKLALDIKRGKVAEDSYVIIDNLAGASVNDAGKNFTDKNGNKITSATGDFILSGKLVITNNLIGNSANAHIQFRFNSSPDCRFVLWDADHDGVFGSGRIGGKYNEDGTKVGNESDKTSGATLYDSKNGLILDWAVVVKDGKAYWYLDGKLVQEMNQPTITYLNIGGTKVQATLYDIDLSIKSEDEAAYNAQMEKYSTESVYVEKYGNNENIAKSGKTYTTDSDGNTLKGTNYVATGKVEIYKTKFSNPHLQFRFNSSYRFLLWDSDGDGLFGIGYTNNGANTNDTVTGEIYQTAKSGKLSFEWAIVVKDGTATLYINGIAKAEFSNLTTGDFSELNLGALQMNVLFYDIEIYAENGNTDKYNAAAAKYN